ncbi:phage baseplate assembly protein V [Comamonadaceae bacterium PP-2]
MSQDQALFNAEVQRLLNNMVREGVISQVDYGRRHGAWVRVRLSEERTSDWLRYAELRAGRTRTWNPPTIGETVIVLAIGGDPKNARVFGGFNTDSNPAPTLDPNKTTIVYPDGAVAEYDHEAHALAITLPAGGTAAITAPASVVIKTDAATIDSPQTTLTGHCTVKGTLTYQGGMKGSGMAAGATASAQIEGTLAASEDLIAAGVSTVKHTHGGVAFGSQQTAQPTPTEP